MKPEDKNMKENIHPNYELQEVRCSCGNVIKTKTTSKNLTVEICSACHPFFTGLRSSLIQLVELSASTRDTIERASNCCICDKSKGLHVHGVLFSCH